MGLSEHRSSIFPGGQLAPPSAGSAILGPNRDAAHLKRQSLTDSSRMTKANDETGAIFASRQYCDRHSRALAVPHDVIELTFVSCEVAVWVAAQSISEVPCP